MPSPCNVNLVNLLAAIQWFFFACQPLARPICLVYWKPSVLQLAIWPPQSNNIFTVWGHVACISVASSAHKVTRGESHLKALSINAVWWRHQSNVVVYAIFGKTRVFCVCMFRSWPCKYSKRTKLFDQLWNLQEIDFRAHQSLCNLRKTRNFTEDLQEFNVLLSKDGYLCKSYVRKLQKHRRIKENLEKSAREIKTLLRTSLKRGTNFVQFISQSLRNHMSTSQLQNQTPTQTHHPLHRILAIIHRWQCRSFLTQAHSWL